MRADRFLKWLVWILSAIGVYFLITAWPFILIICAAIWIYRTTRAGRQLSNFNLLTVSFIISLSLAEIALRVIGTRQVNPEIISNPIHHILCTAYISSFDTDDRGWLYIAPDHLQTPDMKKEFKMSPWMPNREGLHDINWPVAKTNKYRVMAIGDSFTEGVGATDDSTFPRLLALSSDTLEVMNAGLSGSDPAFELRLLDMRLFKYHPDMVIMSVNNTDIGDFMARGGLERFKADSTLLFRKAPWWEPLYSGSFIVRHIAHDICRLDYQFMRPTETDQAHALALGQLTRVIELAADECRSRHIRFVANFHPFQREVIRDSMDCTPVMRAVQRGGVETFDMLDYFKAHNIDSAHAGQYFWPYDGHHNNKGYAVMARGLETLFAGSSQTPH